MLVAQSRPTLCDLMDNSPPGSFVYGILQARILEWVAMPSSRDQTHVSCIGRRILHRLSHLGSPYRAYWLTIEKRKIFCNTEINSCLPLKNFIPRTEVNWQSESWILSLQKELAFVPPRKLASTSPLQLLMVCVSLTRLPPLQSTCALLESGYWSPWPWPHPRCHWCSRNLETP